MESTEKKRHSFKNIWEKKDKLMKYTFFFFKEDQLLDMLGHKREKKKKKKQDWYRTIIFNYFHV